VTDDDYDDDDDDDDGDDEHKYRSHLMLDVQKQDSLTSEFSTTLYMHSHTRL